MLRPRVRSALRTACLVVLLAGVRAEAIAMNIFPAPVATVLLLASSEKRDGPYLGYVVAAISLLVLQSLLIFALLLQRAKRQRAEKARLREKTLSDALIESLPGIFYLEDNNCHLMRWNKNAETVSGFSSAEISQMRCIDFHPEKDKPAVRQAIDDVFEKGSSRVEADLLTRTGGSIPYCFTGVRVDLEGKPCLVGIGMDMTESRRAERALSESETRFRAMFEGSAAGVSVASTDAILLETNQAFQDFLGYSAEELRNQSILKLIHPDDIPMTVEAIQKALAGEISSYRHEKRYLHKNGQVRWGDLSCSLVRNDLGQPQHFVAQVTDITDRKKTKGAIRTIVEEVRGLSSGEFFTSMASQLAHCLGADHTLIGELVDDTGNSIRTLGVYLNGQIVENLTYDLVGTPCENVVSKRVCSYPSDVAALFPKDTMLQDMGVEGYSGVPLFDSHNRAVGLVAAMYNKQIENTSFSESILQVFSGRIAAEIERKRAEEELRAAEERFFKAFQNNPESFTISTLANGKYIDANDAFLSMMGYEHSDVIGKTAGELEIWVHPEQRVELVKRLLAHQSVKGEEIALRTRTGEIRKARVSAEVIQLQNQSCLLAIAHDITDEEIIQQQRRQAQKMEAVGRLAGGIAHDFNNLLSVILGYSELLADELEPNSPLLHRVEAIQKSGKSAAALTSQLLSFSRMQMLQPKVLNLNATVAETEKILRRVIGEDVELTIVLDPSLEQIKADPSHLLQVLMNLAANARDAMPKGGKLVIRTKSITFSEDTIYQGIPIPGGSYALLEVADTGVGMDKEARDHIFEPFFTTKPANKGTGLGMATVYGIVKQSSGFIFVESKQGQGTTFRIYLPLVAAKEEKSPVGKAVPSAAGGAETILLVEDEVQVRELLSQYLEDSGYNVLTAENGADAIRVVQSSEAAIDLVITDVIMPQMSGPELARWLNRERPDTRVLYISGYAADKLADVPLSDPGVALLQKPFQLSDFARKIQDILKQRRDVPVAKHVLAK